MWERSLEERGNYSVGISREAFWHVFAKIPRHTRQNAITEGDLECILTRNCEGTEQLQLFNLFLCFIVTLAKLRARHEMSWFDFFQWRLCTLTLF